MVDAYRVEEWLRSRSKSVHCPCCGSQNFGAEDMLAMTNSVEANTGRINYLRGFPLVVLICQDCAHVMFFGAKKMGIYKEN